jgi:hypothetical protein
MTDIIAISFDFVSTILAAAAVVYTRRNCISEGSTHDVEFVLIHANNEEQYRATLSGFLHPTTKQYTNTIMRSLWKREYG